MSQDLYQELSKDILAKLLYISGNIVVQMSSKWCHGLFGSSQMCADKQASIYVCQVFVGIYNPTSIMPDQFYKSTFDTG